MPCSRLLLQLVPVLLRPSMSRFRLKWPIWVPKRQASFKRCKFRRRLHVVPLKSLYVDISKSIRNVLSWLGENRSSTMRRNQNTNSMPTDLCSFRMTSIWSESATKSVPVKQHYWTCWIFRLSAMVLSSVKVKWALIWFLLARRHDHLACLVYDAGSCFQPSILDIKPADLRAKFSQGVQRVAAFSLGINYPNQASAPHLVLGGFKRLLALAANSDVEFEQAKTVSWNLAE